MSTVSSESPLSIVSAYVREHPEATLDLLVHRFPGYDVFTLRRTLRDARAAASLAAVTEEDVLVSTPMRALSQAAQLALRAGFFRPLSLHWTDIKRAKPTMRRAGHTVVQLPDVHAPEHDPHAWDVALQITEAVGPDEICLSGDQFDVGSLSKYAPSAERPLRWVEERAEAIKPFIHLRALFPDTVIHWLHGNHDVRPMTWISANAPALQGLLTLPELLGITDLGFCYPEHNRLVLAGGRFVIKHGTAVSGEAGASVTKEVRKSGISTAMGHVHRLAYYSVSRLAQEISGDQPLFGVEAGCLQTKRPSYLAAEETANWQQGMVVYSITEAGYVIPELVPIHNGGAVFRGRIFQSRV